MTHYALQAAYTPLGWAALLKEPQHRLEAIKPVIERLGGTVVNGWFMFGEYDLLVICEMPNNVSAAAQRGSLLRRLSRRGLRARCHGWWRDPPARFFCHGGGSDGHAAGRRRAGRDLSHRPHPEQMAR